MTTPNGSRKSLRILVTPLNGHGHINAAQGCLEELRDRGHQVIFLLDPDFSGKVAKYGFQERLLPSLEKATSGDGKEFWQSFLEKNADRFAEPPLEQVEKLMPEIFTVMFEMQKTLEAPYQAAIDDIKPDIIIHDGYVCFPTVVNQSTIPWVWLFSASPQAMLLDARIPPYYTGLPLADSSEWVKYTEKTNKAMASVQKAISDHNVARGGEPLPAHRVHPLSKHLNLYMSPKELRYPIFDELPDTIVGVDGFVRVVPDQVFDIPKQLQNLPGRLIFFSMGSFGTANLAMMTRLVAMLAKSPNRFIVSKGPLQYDLPGENLWGDKFLPQTAILPIVDLVSSASTTFAFI